tara:strand:- start:1522 stop:2448 length:927 start_codon:yes stop_codon:yes gene_type:complete
MRILFIKFLIILIFFNFKIANSEVFIKAKINDQIITNIDVKDEKNYLLALNPRLKNLSNEEINRYALDSLINEKIKKIEIEKRFEILVNNKMINKIISDLYLGIGLADIKEFERHLKNFDIDMDLVKNKISVEIAWNDFIFNNYNKAILIDEDKIRVKIKELSKKNLVENIFLSEIIFTVKEGENLNNKLNQIKNSINDIGFEETAKIYSVSESRKNGGKIGWVFKSQLSNKILNEIEKIDIGELTDPITTPGGFILLTINEKKNELIQINENEQFKKAVKFEKNRQLTMYSTLQYKRAYNKTLINEF